MAVGAFRYPQVPTTGLVHVAATRDILLLLGGESKDCTEKLVSLGNDDNDESITDNRTKLLRTPTLAHFALKTLKNIERTFNYLYAPRGSRPPFSVSCNWCNRSLTCLLGATVATHQHPPPSGLILRVRAAGSPPLPSSP